jgi:hypothetical protein
MKCGDIGIIVRIAKRELKWNSIITVKKKKHKSIGNLGKKSNVKK